MAGGQSSRIRTLISETRDSTEAGRAPPFAGSSRPRSALGSLTVAALIARHQGGGLLTAARTKVTDERAPRLTQKGDRARLRGGEGAEEGTGEYPEEEHPRHCEREHDGDARRDARRAPFRRALAEEHHDDQAQVIVYRNRSVKHADDDEPLVVLAQGGAEDHDLPHEARGQRHAEEA